MKRCLGRWKKSSHAETLRIHTHTHRPIGRRSMLSVHMASLCRGEGPGFVDFKVMTSSCFSQERALSLQLEKPQIHKSHTQAHTERVSDWHRCVCVCASKAKVFGPWLILLLLYKGQRWNCAYVYSTSCIMCMDGCRLLNCASSVIMGPAVLYSSWYNGRDHREAKQHQRMSFTINSSQLHFVPSTSNDKEVFVPSVVLLVLIVSILCHEAVCTPRRILLLHCE